MTKERIERILKMYPLLESRVVRGLSMLEERSPSPPGWSGIDYSMGMDYDEGSPVKPLPMRDNIPKSLVEEYVMAAMPDPELQKDILKLEKIQETLKALSEEERKVVECKYWKGLSDTQVGVIIGISRRTVIRKKKEIIDKMEKNGL